eukprot:1175538-Rhodomonas_salina.1
MTSSLSHTRATAAAGSKGRGRVAMRGDEGCMRAGWLGPRGTRCGCAHVRQPACHVSSETARAALCTQGLNRPPEVVKKLQFTRAAKHSRCGQEQPRGRCPSVPLTQA